MQDTLLWSAFVVGLLGSLHCIGMCGPIALALPAGTQSRARLLSGRLLYNTGRIITYTLMGAVCGLIGKALSLAGWQQGLSIAAGIAILVAVLLPSTVTRHFLPSSVATTFVGRVSNYWKRLFAQGSLPSLLAIGLLNGLLPCGFLYMALGAASVTGSPQGAALYMALFGLGTVPAVLATSLFGPLLGLGLRQRLTRWLPVGAAALGLLLVLRGLSLGIPYVSPQMNHSVVATNPSCH